MENKSCEQIKHESQLLAIILYANFTADKTTFFSPNDFSQQLGYIVYKKKGVINAHFHKEVHRKITRTQEVLFIKRGRVKVNFYTVGKEYLRSRELGVGDLIFLCTGGHGFEILDDAEIIEVKQGPYSTKENDKEVFNGVEE